MALLLPCWLQRHTSGSCTGVPWLDIALHGLLMTPAFLGGFLAFCLDHTVSGTLDERGLMQASTGEPCTDAARNGRPDVLAPPCRFRHFRRGMCPLLKRPSVRRSTSVQFPELDSLTRPTLRISHTDMETSI
uniref:Uncharacterized protein n=1 Tax=Eptatretus burgeri TaxID=7764 RepID=A0A8C4WVP4_EPTBU